MLLSNCHIVKHYTHASYSPPIQLNEHTNILIVKMEIKALGDTDWKVSHYSMYTILARPSGVPGASQRTWGEKTLHYKEEEQKSKREASLFITKMRNV